MGSKHVKQYRKRLALRAGGRKGAKPLELPTELVPYVPPGMQLKDYQIEGARAAGLCVAL